MKNKRELVPLTFLNLCTDAIIILVKGKCVRKDKRLQRTNNTVLNRNCSVLMGFQNNKK